MSTWPVEGLLAATLVEFDLWLQSSGWRAKENDCVNQFAHAHLAKRITSGGVLFDLAQISIEVGVPQPPGWGKKKGVRKDLLIWPEPSMTTFDAQFRPVHTPIAVIEWKARKKALSEYDLDWLVQFTRAYPHCFGAAVTVDFERAGSRLHTAAVRAGVVDRNWPAGFLTGGQPVQNRNANPPPS